MTGLWPHTAGADGHLVVKQFKFNSNDDYGR
jgi:hypothetical protein